MVKVEEVLLSECPSFIEHSADKNVKLDKVAQFSYRSAERVKLLSDQ